MGAGKSTVARALAKRLGYAYLDTGAMYRAIGWKANAAGIECNKENMEKLCENTTLEVTLSEGEQVIIVDGMDITAEIRTPEMSRMSSIVSAYGPVRQYLLKLQREAGSRWAKKYGGVVVEGRDMGTIVFPDARFKFFIDADISERGRRRWKELREKGIDVELTETIQKIEERDSNDKGRSLAPLKKAEDAAEIDTTGLGLDEVVDNICRIIQSSQVKN